MPWVMIARAIPAILAGPLAGVMLDRRGHDPVATRLAKESVDRAFESTLATGLEAERRALYLAFASEDAKEGLTAFTEKRSARFVGS